MFWTLVGLGICFFLSIWVYNDAKKRERELPLLWAIAVFFVWILFFPIYLATRPDKTLIIKKQPELCPHCGKYYEPPVKFCPNCGHQLS